MFVNAPLFITILEITSEKNFPYMPTSHINQSRLWNMEKFVDWEWWNKESSGNLALQTTSKLSWNQPDRSVIMRRGKKKKKKSKKKNQKSDTDNQTKNRHTHTRTIHTEIKNSTQTLATQTHARTHADMHTHTHTHTHTHSRSNLIQSLFVY